MKIIDRIKNLLEGKDKKKIIENAAIAIIIGIIVIIAGNSIFGGRPDTAGKAVEAESKDKINAADMAYEDEESKLEKKLKSVLEKIKGVGEVEVMVTFYTGTENIHAYDSQTSESTTSENDGSGGTRSIVQTENSSSIVFEDNGNGIKSPVVVKDIKPVVKGVLVVAKGAGNPVTRETIIKSVQVLTDIPVHRIQVAEKK